MRGPLGQVWLALFMVTACVTTTSEPVVHSPSRPRDNRASARPDAGPSQPAQNAAPLPSPDFSKLLEELGTQLVGPDPALRGALWVKTVPTETVPERLGERLMSILQRRDRPIASSMAEAKVMVVLQPSVQLDVVEGRRSRTLTLLGLVVAPQTGELLAVRGSYERTHLDEHGRAAATAHPTAGELLDLASDVGQVLRDKLRQLSLPATGVVFEVQPVRNKIDHMIQADLAALWILKTIGTVPGVHAVLNATRWGVTPPPATALKATHVLKAELSSSGGTGQASRLAIHLTARLVPLISTNAALLDADATLLPPLLPDAK